MTTTEIKTETQKIIDNVPESALKDVLDFLKELQERSTDNILIANHLKKILTEDKELLQQLAE